MYAVLMALEEAWICSFSAVQSQTRRVSVHAAIQRQGVEMARGRLDKLAKQASADYQELRGRKSTGSGNNTGNRRQKEDIYTASKQSRHREEWRGVGQRSQSAPD